MTFITGFTALMEASYKSHLEIVCSLLEYNADVIAKTDGRNQMRIILYIDDEEDELISLCLRIKVTVDNFYSMT